MRVTRLAGRLAWARATYLADRAGMALAGQRFRLRRPDRRRHIHSGLSTANVDHERGLAADRVVHRAARMARLPPLGSPEQSALPAAVGCQRPLSVLGVGGDQR